MTIRKFVLQCILVAALALATPLSALAQSLVTGTVAASGENVGSRVLGLGTVSVQITGTWAATLAFEGTVDNVNWFAVNASPMPSGAMATSTTANGQWSVMISGLQGVRVRASAYTSGTATVWVGAASSRQEKSPSPTLFGGDIILSNTTGAEKLTNGTFTGSATDWTLAAGFTYNANAVDKDGDGTGTLAEDAFAAVANDVYLLTYVITNWTVGTVTPSLGGATGTAVGANGTYREVLRATSTASLAFTPTNTARFTIDTISVKRLTSQAADQVACWVEDQAGVAGKAGLYCRGEDGGIIGLAGEVLSFGAFNEKITLTRSTDTLTLAGLTTLKFPSGMIQDWNSADVTLTHSSNMLTIVGGDLTSPNYYIGSGGKIDFAAADVTLTHSADILTLAGGVFIVPGGSAAAPSITFTGGSTSGFYYAGSTGLSTAVGGVIVSAWNSLGQALKSTGRLSWNAATDLSGSDDLFLGRDAAAILQQGLDSATPVAQTFKGPDGSGTDKAGGDVTLAAGRGTGTGAGGSLILATAPVGGGSGSSQNALVNRVTVNAAGAVLVTDLKTTGAAAGKTLVCVDTATGQLYASTSNDTCAN